MARVIQMLPHSLILVPMVSLMTSDSTSCTTTHPWGRSPISPYLVPTSLYLSSMTKTPISTPSSAQSRSTLGLLPASSQSSTPTQRNRLSTRPLSDSVKVRSQSSSRSRCSRFLTSTTWAEKSLQDGLSMTSTTKISSTLTQTASRCRSVSRTKDQTILTNQKCMLMTTTTPSTQLWP